MGHSGYTTPSFGGGLNLTDVYAARMAIDGRLLTTPLFGSRRSSERTGARVLFKAELFQRTGSFKPRGVLAKLATLTEDERARGVVAASSGNHAQALAFGARELGIPCTAVMWPGVSQHKLEATRSYGAAIDMVAEDGAAALSRARVIAEDNGMTIVPAYDDRAVMAGQGTVALEILDQEPEVDAVVVPVSGGGLLAGTALTTKAIRPQTRIIAVEPESSPSLARALSAGHPVPTADTSMADALGAPAIGETCLAVAAPLIDQIVHVTDAEIVEAMAWIYQTLKLACEPAGAASTAALLTRRVRLEPTETAVAIVSGGNVDASVAAQLLAAAVLP